MKKKLFVLATIAIVMAIVAGGTVAYFTADTQVHNVITSGEIDIDLVETMVDKNDTDGDNNTTEEVPYPTTGVGGIMPGTDHSKIVRVHNIGSNPAWVRVKVIKKVTAEVDGKKTELPADVLTLDFDTTKWLKDGDYYYYKDVLPAGGETVKPLFTKVSFAGAGMDNRYQNATITIDVQAYATQSQNNPIPADGDVTDVKGWPSELAMMLFG